MSGQQHISEREKSRFSSEFSASTISVTHGIAQATHLLQAVLSETVQPFHLTMKQTDRSVMLEGDWEAVDVASAVLRAACEAQHSLTTEWLMETIAETISHKLSHELSFRLNGILGPVVPGTLAQRAFLNELLHGGAPITLGLGATGTGKSHLVVAAAINLLATEKIKRVIVTRPHTLRPGEVMTPEIRWETRTDEQFTPLTDIFVNLTSSARLKDWLDTRQVELVPAGLLLGRTFNDAVIIIDEAQNFDIPTMRMAITRMGQNSRIFMTGDPTQTQLRTNEPSGLPHFIKLIEGTDIASTFWFENSQIVRNPTVATIESLYADTGIFREGFRDIPDPRNAKFAH